MRTPAEPDGTPSSYDELFDQYFDYVKGLVWKLGIRANEDVAQEIILRFYARGFLTEYNPAVVSHGKQTSFKAFLRAFVERYSRHYRERQGVHDFREPVICDRPTASGKLFVEVHQKPHYDDPSAALDEQALVLLCRERLSEVPNRGRRDLLRLFNLIVPMVSSQEKLDRNELARQYGVSPSVISSMLIEMRTALAYLSP